jgi:hypothetical protein
MQRLLFAFIVCKMVWANEWEDKVKGGHGRSYTEHRRKEARQVCVKGVEHGWGVYAA